MEVCLSVCRPCGPRGCVRDARAAEWSVVALSRLLALGKDSRTFTLQDVGTPCVSLLHTRFWSWLVPYGGIRLTVQGMLSHPPSPSSSLPLKLNESNKYLQSCGGEEPAGAGWGEARQQREN